MRSQYADVLPKFLILPVFFRTTKLFISSCYRGFIPRTIKFLQIMSLHLEFIFVCSPELISGYLRRLDMNENVPAFYIKEKLNFFLLNS